MQINHRLAVVRLCAPVSLHVSQDSQRDGHMVQRLSLQAQYEELGRTSFIQT